MGQMSAIHAGFRQLGISDEADQRALYRRVTGKSGLTLMLSEEKAAVLGELRRLGLSTTTTRRKLSGPYAGKLQALWIAAYNLGIVRERDDRALEAFVLRQTGIQSERWLRYPDDASKVIEALKGWMAREAGVDWRAQIGAPDFARRDAYRIARAQWMKLCPAAPNDFWPVVTDLLHQEAHYRPLRDEEWIPVMNAFGARIRKALPETAP